MARRSRICLDLALDLMLPPLSYLALGILVVVAIGFVPIVAAPFATAMRWIGFTSAAILAAHVIRGWQISGVGLRGALDLARVPFFIIWKVVALVVDHAPRDWVRTDRNRP